MSSWLEKSELENAQLLLTIIAKKQYMSLKLLTLWANPIPLYQPPYKFNSLCHRNQTKQLKVF